MPSRRYLLAAATLFSVLFVSQAQAARVHSLQPWKRTNTYRGLVDIDGRNTPQLEPRAFTSRTRAGTLAQAFLAKIHSNYKSYSSFFGTFTGFVGTVVANRFDA